MTTENKLPPPPTATRRVKLRFDKDGSPAYESVTSPECFKQTAFGVVPPRDVIPVIFVPGIAGSLLKVLGGNTSVWDPLNDLTKTMGRPLRLRQKLFDPQKTEVMLNGKFSVPDKVYWLTTEEAIERRWGGLFNGYHEFLQKLEMTLNDQYTDPGREHNYLMPEIGMAEYLKGGPEKTKDSPPQAGQKKPDYAKEAQKAMKAWGTKPKALAGAELKKLEDYYYPVWAFPYNWLDDLENAANELVKYIQDKVLAHYAAGKDAKGKEKYFRHQNKVIIVTHSMGGLVGRRAAQIDGSKMLGVVHGVCPLAGAAVMYRRMRAGQEGGGIKDNVIARIMGETQERMTVQIGRSPGALTLAPTKDYKKHWLKAYAGGIEDEKGLIFSLPEKDPYTEIYARTADEVWWGMVDPKMLDPLGEMTGKDENTPTPKKAYTYAMKLARDFHDRLKLYAHPETYGFYGTDNGEYRSFRSVSWLLETAKDSRFNSLSDDVLYGRYADKTACKAVMDAKASRNVEGVSSNYTLVLVPDKANPNKKDEVPFRITEHKDARGDGTVPDGSGEMLNKLEPPPKEVIGFPGYDHQAAYDDENVFLATVYFIARIVQKADAPPMSCSK